MLQAEARVKALEREKQELTWQLTKIKEEMEELRWMGGLLLSSVKSSTVHVARRQALVLFMGVAAVVAGLKVQ